MLIQFHWYTKNKVRLLHIIKCPYFRNINIIKNIYTKFSVRHILAALLLGLLLFSFSDYHLNRNINNQLPIGKLSNIDEITFSDEMENTWILQPNSKNEFHQPSEIFLNDVSFPYSILEIPPKINPEYPYLKLLCIQKDGSSYEAILKPNNEYLTIGKERGTFNYASPEGLWGSIKHTFIDVIPHFICSEYEQRL